MFVTVEWPATHNYDALSQLYIGIPTHARSFELGCPGGHQRHQTKVRCLYWTFLEQTKYSRPLQSALANVPLRSTLSRRIMVRGFKNKIRNQVINEQAFLTCSSTGVASIASHARHHCALPCTPDQITTSSCSPRLVCSSRPRNVFAGFALLADAPVASNW